MLPALCFESFAVRKVKILSLFYYYYSFPRRFSRNYLVLYVYIPVASDVSNIFVPHFCLPGVSLELYKRSSPYPCMGQTKFFYYYYYYFLFSFSLTVIFPTFMKRVFNPLPFLHLAFIFSASTTNTVKKLLLT